jgi:hypothetical protein
MESGGEGLLIPARLQHEIAGLIGQRGSLSFLLVECSTHRPREPIVRGPGRKITREGGNGEDAASNQQILLAGIVEFA